MREYLWAAVVGLVLSGSAWASLGGDRESVRSDRHAWEASHSHSYISGATVHTQVLPNGITVRQYVDPAGLVFAVAWEGPVMPDFARLLGNYFPSYQEALRQQKRGVSVNTADLVLESGGMMRAFYGRAYLPARLPVSLTAQDIR